MKKATLKINKVHLWKCLNRKTFYSITDKYHRIFFHSICEEKNVFYFCFNFLPKIVFSEYKLVAANNKAVRALNFVNFIKN